MKAYFITAPLGALLALAGIAMVKSAPSIDILDGASAAIPTRHPVTEEMKKAAASLKRTPAPLLTAKDYLGNNYQIDILKQGYPTLLIFIKSGCPCSIDAQPIFNNIAAAYGPHARFIGIYDGDSTDAKAFAEFNKVTFPIITDEKNAWVKAYKMVASASMALVDGKGQIVEVWPGYSQSIMRQSNFLLGTLTDQGPQEFDYSKAPKDLTAGCAFEL